MLSEHLSKGTGACWESHYKRQVGLSEWPEPWVLAVQTLRVVWRQRGTLWEAAVTVERERQGIASGAWVLGPGWRAG